VGTGDLGTEVPQWCSGAEPQWGLGRSPQKPDMHTQSAVDKCIFVMRSYKIYGVPHAESATLTPTAQKTLRICTNLRHPNPTKTSVLHF